MYHDTFAKWCFYGVGDKFKRFRLLFNIIRMFIHLQVDIMLYTYPAGAVIIFDKDLSSMLSFVFSKAPKKMEPPTPIHKILGPKPYHTNPTLSLAA